MKHREKRTLKINPNNKPWKDLRDNIMQTTNGHIHNWIPERKDVMEKRKKNWRKKCWKIPNLMAILKIDLRNVMNYKMNQH